jgi:hypothetical protein
MSEPNPVAQAAPIRMLAEWEGPAIPAPGVLLDEGQVEQLSVEPDVAALAAWIAVTAMSEANDNPAHEAIKQKARGVLAASRQRFGEVKIDEIKQELLRQMQQYWNQRKLTDDELRVRIDQLFDAI